VPEVGISGLYGRLFLLSAVGDEIAREAPSRAHAGVVERWLCFEEKGNSQRGVAEA
jgi:hypothetical protein